MILQNCVHRKCKTLIESLKIVFSVILFTARLRKQFVSCGILMGYHVTAAGFILVYKLGERSCNNFLFLIGSEKILVDDLAQRQQVVVWTINRLFTNLQ